MTQWRCRSLQSLIPQLWATELCSVLQHKDMMILKETSSLFHGSVIICDVTREPPVRYITCGLKHLSGLITALRLIHSSSSRLSHGSRILDSDWSTAAFCGQTITCWCIFPHSCLFHVSCITPHSFISHNKIIHTQLSSIYVPMFQTPFLNDFIIQILKSSCNKHHDPKVNQMKRKFSMCSHYTWTSEWTQITFFSLCLYPCSICRLYWKFAHPCSIWG